MKTVLQHLKSMPSPLGEMAIAEAKRQGFGHLLSNKRDFLSKAISGYFSWADAEMDDDFWIGVYEDARFIEYKISPK